ncbi:MAG TPA: hypothetical protein VIO61_06150 [Anaerolineaceae bacterium]
MASRLNQVIFQRRAEPNENACTILVPEGWLLEGGVFRANLMAQRVTAQTIEAKMDLSVKKDAQGTVMLRAVPEMKYCDPRYLTYGFFPVGSNYMGMIVYPLMPPAQFLAQMMFPWAHPQATQAQMVDAKPWDEYVEKYRRGAAQSAAMYGLQITYDGAEVTFIYEEMGVRYKEKAWVVLENLGPMSMGSWSNKSTHYYRAPEAEFEDWEPVLFHMARSVQTNPQWQAQEQASQQMLMGSYRQGQIADQERARKALETQRYMQDSLNQMLEHKRVTQEEIRNDQYLMMTNQEEYVNPFTNEIDTGSNQFNYRWVTDSGDEFYTNNESDNPNDASGVLNRTDWKRTPVRPRRPYD